jgi:hypothetical protein
MQLDTNVSEDHPASIITVLMVDILLHGSTASQPSRPQFESPSLQKPQISHHDDLEINAGFYV